ncbi:MAG: cellulose synthase catalytic subunit, partial [Tolypothrix sp. T3-bin4]|nr:cellulose synthase catalytic subunit [Tolypothrix sp. T3-bin4]
MAVSEFSRKNSKRRLLRRVFRLRLATLVMLSVVVCASALSTAWSTGEGTMSHLFAYLQALQENPPIWLEVPAVSSNYYLLAPTVI